MPAQISRDTNAPLIWRTRNAKGTEVSEIPLGERVSFTDDSGVLYTSNGPEEVRWWVVAKQGLVGNTRSVRITRIKEFSGEYVFLVPNENGRINRYKDTEGQPAYILQQAMGLLR